MTMFPAMVPRLIIYYVELTSVYSSWFCVHSCAFVFRLPFPIDPFIVLLFCSILNTFQHSCHNTNKMGRDEQISNLQNIVISLTLLLLTISRAQKGDGLREEQVCTFVQTLNPLMY